MTENQILMQKAASLNLTYEQVYSEMENIFPVKGQYVGSLANHFRGKLKIHGTVDGLIQVMDNNTLRRLINHFSPVTA